MRSLVQPPPPPTSAAAATGPAATSEATSEATSMADEQKIDEDPPQARRGLTNLFGLLGRT
jgi:ribosomal protein L12E/L44/L45/RPP1/RPP2